MASEQQRCKYEILGLQNNCTAEEVRSAYKELALQHHPDKLVRVGISYLEAAALFQELISAYKILSDPKERASYDSHRRSQILSSDGHSDNNNHNSGGYPAFTVPDLTLYRSISLFPGGYTEDDRGFYKVYSDLFDKIHANELKFSKKLGLELPEEAPVMGNLESPYKQVKAFYRYWSMFFSVMDYDWVDEYNCRANWKHARREYSKTVLQLVHFVTRMDKRVVYINLLKPPPDDDESLCCKDQVCICSG